MLHDAHDIDRGSTFASLKCSFSSILFYNFIFTKKTLWWNWWVKIHVWIQSTAQCCDRVTPDDFFFQFRYHFNGEWRGSKPMDLRTKRDVRVFSESRQGRSSIYIWYYRVNSSSNASILNDIVHAWLNSTWDRPINKNLDGLRINNRLSLRS